MQENSNSYNKTTALESSFLKKSTKKHVRIRDGTVHTVSAYVDSDHIITRCIIMSFRIVSFTEHSLKPGWGCSSVGRALDRHGADAGSIPRCGKGFFSPSQLSVLTLHGVRTPPCAIACIYICAHVKDLVVYVRVRWIMETLKHPACTVEHSMGEIPMGQYSCKKKKKVHGWD